MNRGTDEYERRALPQPQTTPQLLYDHVGTEMIESQQPRS